jgi:peptidoglycan/LPS O-acetylase OafA/YrhL
MPQVDRVGHTPLNESARPTGIPSGNIPALDGLRGIAILLVMAQHFIPLEASPAGEQMLRLVAASGWAGVDLFFVLSGFLITRILLDARGTGHVWLPFYARRALRILPAFIVVMLALLVLAGQTYRLDSAGFGMLLANQWWQWSFLTNIRIAVDGSWRLFPYTGHLWSLGVEEQFYLLWPAAVLALSHRRLVLTAIAAVVIAPLFRAALIAGNLPPIGALVLAPAKMDELALGGLIALAMRDQTMRSRISRLVKATRGGTIPFVAFIVAATMATTAVVVSQHASVIGWSYILGQSAVAVSAACVLASLADQTSRDRFVRLCERPWLRRVGTYSYGLYLVHYPLDKIARKIDPAPGLFRRAISSHLLADLTYAVALTMISIALAAILWHALEQPIMRLRSRFPYGKPSAASRDVSVPGVQALT